MAIKQVHGKNGRRYEINGNVGKDSQGKRIRIRKRGFTSKRQAEAWLAQEQVLFRNGKSKYNIEEKVQVSTIKDLYDMWLSTYQGTVEESTLKKTLEIFKLHILPQWGDIKVDQIKPMDLQTYVNDLQQKILHYKKILNYLQRLVQLATRMGMIQDNPFSKITLPAERKKTKKEKKYMEEDEFKEFINVLDTKYRFENFQAFVLLRLVALTGLRTEEVLALQWESVDFDNGKIEVCRALGRGLKGSYIKDPKSQSSFRTLKVADHMMKILYDWYASSEYINTTDFVFHHQGNHLQIMRPNKWLRDVAKEYNVAVDISMHELRHTWATLALNQGATVKQVQDYLGLA